MSGLLACVSVSSAVPRRLPPLHNTESFRLKDNIRPYIDRGRKNTAIERSSAGLYERPYGHRPASLEVNGDGSIILNEDGSLKMHERRRSARKVFEERNDNEATSTEDEESSATTSSKEIRETRPTRRRTLSGKLPSLSPHGPPTLVRTCK